MKKPRHAPPGMRGKLTIEYPQSCSRNLEISSSSSSSTRSSPGSIEPNSELDLVVDFNLRNRRQVPLRESRQSRQSKVVFVDVVKLVRDRLAVIGVQSPKTTRRLVSFSSDDLSCGVFIIVRRLSWRDMRWDSPPRGEPSPEATRR